MANKTNNKGLAIWMALAALMLIAGSLFVSAHGEYCAAQGCGHGSVDCGAVTCACCECQLCGCNNDCGSCFLPGTPVTMADGSKKAIEDVKVDDEVMGYDIDKKIYVTSTVLTLESPIRKDYYTIMFDDDSELNVTNEHPIYIRSFFYEGWGSIMPELTLKDAGMAVQAISVGDEVFKGDRWVTITDIIHILKEVQTYNLKKVSNTNTFFAGDVLVHNKGCSAKSCSDLDKECDKWGDGCGGTVNCGSCKKTGEICNKGNCCYPASLSCTKDSDCCSKNCWVFTENVASAGMIAWKASVQPKCCNATDILDATSKCVPTNTNGQAIGAGVPGNDTYAAPTPSGWADCDSSIGPGATGACRNICPTALKAGADVFGEYTDRTTGACCGDDAGEYRAIGAKTLASEGRCCPRSDDCVDSSGNCVVNGTVSYTEGKICTDCGWAVPNWDWTQAGCCATSNMCLVNSNGDPAKGMMDWYAVNWKNNPLPMAGPQCINPGEYILDHRCSTNSDWVSRTSYISMMMLTKAEEAGGNYTLFCDNFTNVLNYYSYPIGDLALDFSYLNSPSACGYYPCLNNYFCVLLDSAGKVRAVGGTLNPDKTGDLNNLATLYKVLGLPDDTNCPTDPSNVFADCGQGLSFNSPVSAFVYTKSQTSLKSNLVSDFIAWFRSLLGQYKTQMPKDIRIGVYETRSPSLNKLYVMKTSDKMIYAIQDSTDRMERIFANYSHFNTDVCGLLNKSGYMMKGSTSCNSDAANQYFFANRSAGSKVNPIFDGWTMITSKMRVSYQEFNRTPGVCIGLGDFIPNAQNPPSCCAGLVPVQVIGNENWMCTTPT